MRCFCLCILYGWKLLEMLSFVFFKFICFDESYLRCFCLCFKCLEFLHKKIIILIIICPDNLNIYTSHTIKRTEWPVWPNGWAFVYELSGSVFDSSCSHLSFRFSRKEFLDIQATIQCGFTLKCERSMTRTYSQMHLTDKYSEHSSIIWSVWPNGWVFVYELNGSGFESSCSHLYLQFVRKHSLGSDE